MTAGGERELQYIEDFENLESRVEPVEVVRRPADPRRSSSGDEQQGQCLRHQTRCRHLPDSRMKLDMCGMGRYVQKVKTKSDQYWLRRGSI